MEANSMKTVSIMAAQGDVLFRRVDSLPAGVRREPREGPIVVAHSETGHHHVVASEQAEFYSTANPLVGFLRFDGAFADVEHLRPYHTHETLRLLGNDDEPAFYEVRRQREHTFTGWQRSID
jgi:hypothetical protein